MSAGRTVWVATALLALRALVSPAQEPTADAAGPALIVFDRPAATEPAVGVGEIAVTVMADEEVEEVVFLVDGTEVGRLVAPPYRLSHDFGGALGSRVVEVVARMASGAVARAERVTPAVRVDDTIDLGLRQLYVTVDRRDGGPMDLAATDFRVRDDGAQQTLVTFEGGDAALAVALLVDASDSMRGERLAAALEGVEAFLAGMRELDEAAIYLFSDSIRPSGDFSLEPGELTEKLQSVEAAGGTALNDTLYVALRALEARQGRRVAVVLSDGFDIHSVLRIEDVLWAMRRGRSMVYWIALEEGQSSILSAWRTPDEHAEERRGLERLVEESGGRVIKISGPAEARSAFAEILSELRRQFVLGYYPTVRLADGRWHRVDVRVRRPGFVVRTRGGYVDW